MRNILQESKKAYLKGSQQPLQSQPNYSTSLSATVRYTASPSIAYWGRRLVVLILLIWIASLGIGFRPALTALTLVSFVTTIVGLRWPTIGLLGIGVLCTLDPLAGPWVLTGGLLR